MSPDKYDLRDAAGRKIGTIEPSSGCGPIVLLVVFGIIVGLIVAIYNGIAYVIHPTMPSTFFTAKDARSAGSVVADDEMQLNTGGSLEFSINNTYSEGDFLLWAHSHWRVICKDAFFVNGIKMPDSALCKLSGIPPATIHLQQGLNKLRFVNTGTGSYSSINVSGIILKEK